MQIRKTFIICQSNELLFLVSGACLSQLGLLSKHHRLRDLNNGQLFPTILEDEKSKIGYHYVWVLVRAIFLICRQFVSSHGPERAGREGLQGNILVSSYKDSNPILRAPWRLGLHQMYFRGTHKHSFHNMVWFRISAKNLKFIKSHTTFLKMFSSSKDLKKADVTVFIQLASPDFENRPCSSFFSQPLWLMHLPYSDFAAQPSDFSDLF